jgi:hypothetical protein
LDYRLLFGRNNLRNSQLRTKIFGDFNQVEQTVYEMDIKEKLYCFMQAFDQTHIENYSYNYSSMRKEKYLSNCRNFRYNITRDQRLVVMDSKNILRRIKINALLVFCFTTKFI